MQAGPCTVTIAWASPSLSLLAFPGGEPTWVPSWSSTTSAPEAAASDRSEEPSSARVKSSKPAAHCLDPIHSVTHTGGRVHAGVYGHLLRYGGCASITTVV